MSNNMINILLVDREGQQHELSIPTDMNLNLMEAIRAHEFDVEGTCGGMALCASCHCYVESDHQLTDPSEDEEDMLDQAFFVEMNSRLSCQIKIDDALDGLQVKLAPVSDT